MARNSDPFHLLVLGDFSGRASRHQVQPVAKRKPLTIDRDNFDDRMAQLNIEIHSKLGDGEPVPFRFRELDDFSPDRLYDQCELFQRLRQTRRRLQNSSTFAEAAAELTLPGAKKEAPAAPAKPAPTPETINIEDILETTQEELRKAAGVTDWQAMIREIVGNTSVPRKDPRQDDYLAMVDEATSEQMRAILHAPTFQSVEAAWRALYLMVRRLETDSTLKVYFLDVSKEELVVEAVTETPLTETGLYKSLVLPTVGTPGGIPWSAIVGNFTFGDSAEDLQLLAQLGDIAATCGATFLGAASGELVGCADPGKTPDPDDWAEIAPTSKILWNEFRKLDSLGHLALVWPRFLLRLPYGKKTTPIDSFAFEELPESIGPSRRHTGYLWGNGAMLVGMLIAQGFSQSGWGLSKSVDNVVDDLPMHVYVEEGEQVVKPCGEILLNERGAERVLARGIIPLYSVRDRTSVQLGRFLSLAITPAPIAGRWS